MTKCFVLVLTLEYRNLSVLAWKSRDQGNMAAGQFSITDAVNGGDEKTKLSSIPPQRSNALSQKISSVLSASYLDTEIKEAVRNLDAKNTQNSPGVRRRLRLDVQKEMIDCNRGIILEFGQVAKVCPFTNICGNASS